MDVKIDRYLCRTNDEMGPNDNPSLFREPQSAVRDWMASRELLC